MKGKYDRTYPTKNPQYAYPPLSEIDYYELQEKIENPNIIQQSNKSSLSKSSIGAIDLKKFNPKEVKMRSSQRASKFPKNI